MSRLTRSTQPSIQNEKALRNLREEFSSRLRQLDQKDLLRHGLAAMALSMQEALSGYDSSQKVMHSDALELIMRGVYTSICGNGLRDYHPVEKLTLGYLLLMLEYEPERREDLRKAFDPFEKLLKKR